MDTMREAGSVLTSALFPVCRPAGRIGAGASGAGVGRGGGHHLLLQVQEHQLHTGAELAPPPQAPAGPAAPAQRPVQLLLRHHEQIHPQVRCRLPVCLALHVHLLIRSFPHFICLAVFLAACL